MALFFNEFLQKKGEVWVVIPDYREIPLMGKGPFLKPERISEENYKILLNLGYKVEKLETTELFRVPLITRPLKNPLNQNIINIDDYNKDKVTLPEIVEETKEEVTEVETVVEETKEEVTEVEDSIVKKDINKLTKAELKAILDEAGVQYKYETKLSELQQLVRDLEK